MHPEYSWDDVLAVLWKQSDKLLLCSVHVICVYSDFALAIHAVSIIVFPLILYSVLIIATIVPSTRECCFYLYLAFKHMRQVLIVICLSITIHIIFMFSMLWNLLLRNVEWR